MSLRSFVLLIVPQVIAEMVFVIIVKLTVFVMKTVLSQIPYAEIECAILMNQGISVLLIVLQTIVETEFVKVMNTQEPVGWIAYLLIPPTAEILFAKIEKTASLVLETAAPRVVVMVFAHFKNILALVLIVLLLLPLAEMIFVIKTKIWKVVQQIVPLPPVEIKFVKQTNMLVYVPEIVHINQYLVEMDDVISTRVLHPVLLIAVLLCAVTHYALLMKMKPIVQMIVFKLQTLAEIELAIIMKIFYHVQKTVTLTHVEMVYAILKNNLESVLLIALHQKRTENVGMVFVILTKVI